MRIVFWLVGVGMAVAAVLPARAARVVLQDNPLYDYSGTADAWLNEGAQRDNHGGATNLQVRYDNGFNENCSLLRFSLPGVDCDAITTAELALYYRAEGSMDANNVMGLKPYRLTADWYENVRDGQSGQGVSWRYRDQNETLTWTGESGGWYDKADDGNGSNLVKRAGGSGSGIEPLHWVPFNVRPSVQQWHGGVSNYGFALFSCSFIGTGYRVWAWFDSREVGAASNRPKLAITYQNARILWEGHASGAWDTNSLNWRVGGVRGWYGNGDHVVFDGGTRTNVTVAAGGVSPGLVVFSNAAGRFTVTGGPIAGHGGLILSGAGTVELKAANTYAGGTLVQAGTLRVNNAAGSGTGTNTVTVNAGATLGGAGAVAGVVSVDHGGWLAPGMSAGTLTLGELHLAESAHLQMDLDSPLTPDSNDLVVVTGDVTLDGTLHVQPGSGFGAGRYVILRYGGGLMDHGLAPVGVAPPYELQVDTGTPSEVALVVECTPDHYVSPTGLNLPPYTNWTEAAWIIQDALDAARSGDTVWVAAGTYGAGGRPAPGMLLTNRAMVGDGVTLRSADGFARTFIVGAPDAAATNGPAAVRGVYLMDHATLIGFTVTNGHVREGGPAEEERGGGVYGAGAVSNCAITGCRARDGGGVYALAGGALVNVLVAGNEATESGGGAYLGGPVQLLQATITDNAAGGHGGGVTVAATATIRNSILYFNEAPLHPNVHAMTAVPFAEYTCALPLMAGPGNIGDDPAFRHADREDYRPRYGSPCVDTGMDLPQVPDDLDGRGRPVDGDFDAVAKYDMGAYEYDPWDADCDEDGMPDGWEHVHGLNPLDPADAEEDPDEDTFSNLHEYIADTNPRSFHSFFRLGMIAEGLPVTVSFQPSALGRWYSLMTSSNLAASDWRGVPGQTNIPGQGGIWGKLADTNSARRSVYRIDVRLDLP